ncbi:competence type IV pilus assembly protein ComGB [Bacillus marasmi]|uniref:competence type IV pilus assembly protein ComGB n=1 Tax=Bacillus marasmi TaxID=1926279 RepID=UPI0011CB3AFF|nr:competence type IV pilus assembly protein ComGB [Bacillus marasmi]
MNKKWSNGQQALFLQRTGELLSHGFSLSEAIESLAYYFPDENKAAIDYCIFQLKEGYPFHQILTNLKFNRSLVGYVYFAEQHGDLAQALLDGSSFMFKRNQDVKRFLKMLNYPVVLMVITGLLFFFVESVLLPRFTAMFESMNLPPNIFSKLILQFSNLFPYFLYAVLVILLLIFLYYYVHFRKFSVYERRSKIVKLPFVGSFCKLWFTQYFAVQLSYLLSGGLSVLEALRMFEDYQQQPFYASVCRELRSNLSKGDRLEDILAKHTVFEAELALIVKHGQESGKLPQELAFYSKHCIKYLEIKTENVLKIVQPCLYVGIGLVVVALYLAIMLPMFHMLKGL